MITGRNAISGRGQGFRPTQINGCVLWLRSDMGITLATGVSQWNDLSGNGNNFSQGTTACQPTYIPQTPTLNGQPSLSFSGAANQVLVAANAVTVPQPFSLILLMACTNGASTPSIIDGNNPEVLVELGSATQIEAYAGSFNSPIVSNMATPSLIQIDFNGASSVIWQNNVQQGSTATIGTNGWLMGYIGANRSGGFGITGTIAEVIAYSGVLTSGQREAVSQYLGARYNIATS